MGESIYTVERYSEATSRNLRYHQQPDTNTNINPFGQWEIDDRYANRMHFVHARVNGHRNAAITVKNLVDKAVSQRELP